MRIGNNFFCGDNFIVSKPIYFKDYYKYHACLFLNKETGEYYSTFGCFTRKFSEWKSDFWNNPAEFPNDGNLESRKRYNLFLLMEKIIEFEENRQNE